MDVMLVVLGVTALAAVVAAYALAVGALGWCVLETVEVLRGAR